jgi:hypothetical protein
VAQFKYLGIRVANQTLIQEEIKRRQNLGNACYRSVQNLWSSRLLSKNLKIRIYKTIILLVVLYGMRSLTLSEENRLKVFENRTVKRTFGPMRDEVTGGSRKLHEELHNLYSSQSIIRLIKKRTTRWAGHVAQMGEKRNVYRILVGKPKGKKPLERHRCRWEDNIKMDLRDMG